MGLFGKKCVGESSKVESLKVIDNVTAIKTCEYCGKVLPCLISDCKFEPACYSIGSDACVICGKKVFMCLDCVEDDCSYLCRDCSNSKKPSCYTDGWD